MRSLLLAILVAWACAEGVAPPRQTPPQNATASVQAPEEQSEEPQEEREEEQQEEPQEEQEAVKAFSYDEWIAEPPVLGEPKIPGPPFPHLEAGGKKEAFDHLRRLRWDTWLRERVVLAEEAWIENWEEWVEDGHLEEAAARTDAKWICNSKQQPLRLRADDQSLREIIDKARIAYSQWREWERELEQKRLIHTHKLRDEIIFDAAAATYFFKLEELRKSIIRRGSANQPKRDTSRRIWVWVGSWMDIRKKIRDAHGCDPNFVDRRINSCWAPSPLDTIENLPQPKCADQR